MIGLNIEYPISDIESHVLRKARPRYPQNPP